MDDFYKGLFGALNFGVIGDNAMSPAGRMLNRMERADKRLESEGITDELLAACRRADILSQREAS